MITTEPSWSDFAVLGRRMRRRNTLCLSVKLTLSFARRQNNGQDCQEKTSHRMATGGPASWEPWPRGAMLNYGGDRGTESKLGKEAKQAACCRSGR